MKKPIAIVIITIVFLICIVINGCNEQEIGNNEEYNKNSKFIGTWITNESTYYNYDKMTFYLNGTCFLNLNNGTYEIDDDILEITIPWKLGKTRTYKYNYSFFDNNTLSITYILNNDTSVYYKQ